MKRLSLLVAVCLMLSCLPRQGEMPAQNAGLSIGDGLSHPNVSCFRQDSHGRMWIGTERGLNRYNGYDFHQYLHSPDSTSLPDNRIYDLCFDKSDRLWVGTEDGVALFTDQDTFERIPINSDEKAVYQILCDNDGHIILNMQEDLCVYDTLSRSFVNKVVGFDRFFSYHSQCHLGRDGLLWVVAPKELRCFNTADGFSNTDNWPTLHFVTESALLYDGQIWMAGRHRLSIFDTGSQRFLKVPDSIQAGLAGLEVQIIFELEPGTVLFKTSDGAFHIYNRGENQMRTVPPQTFGLPSGFDTKTIYKDSAGKLWFGSDDKGFHYHSGQWNNIILKDQSVASMSPDRDGALWLFTLHDGLFRYDPASGAVSRPPIDGMTSEDRTDFLQSNLPLVFATSSGDLWLSFPNQQHLLRGRYENGRIRIQDDFPAFYPRVAIEDGDGGVWFGTRNEFLVHMPPGGTQLERVQIWPYKTTFINCIMQVGEEILVGAYDNPLAMLDMRTRQARRLNLAGQGLETSGPYEFFSPTAACADRDGNIWIGTRFSGILKYNVAMRSLDPVPGSPKGDISSMVKDAQGRIWVCTGDGIFFYDPSSARFTSYLTPEVPGDAVFYDRSSAVLSDGSIAFGGAHGLTIINPSDRPGQAEIPLVFEDLKVHNNLVRPGGGIISSVLSESRDIVLSHVDNAFRVSFAVPDYPNIPRILYSYKLEGYDRDWVQNGRSREVYYSNVPAGRYTLRVRHSLQPGGTDYMENSLRIRVLPSPWLSVYAIAVYTLLIILGSAALLRLRQRLARERAAALQTEREKEQERQVNKMNMTFFTNISHEFRTPLTMISGPVTQLSRSNRLESGERHLLSLVQRNVRRMLLLVNQLLDLGKIEGSLLKLKVAKADIVPVLRDTAEIFRLNADSQGLELKMLGMEYPLQTWFDEDKLVKIISNLLSNALKFTPKGGSVQVELDQVTLNGEPYVQINVSDTGPGIPPQMLEKVFERYFQADNGNNGAYNYGTGIGLFYSRSLAQIHHGTLTAANRPEGGASFTLLLPASEEAYPESERIKEAVPGMAELPLDTVITQEESVSGDDDDRSVILAVDDDSDVLDYLAALFSGSYTVLRANGADEALKTALDKSPDIVLSDVSMPGRSGFDLCRDLKSSLQLSHVPVILVTAKGTVQNQVQGLDLGADAYVTKPFDPDYLKALVKSQLENRRRIRNILNSATRTSEVDTLSPRDRFFLDKLYDLMESEISNEDLDITRLTELLKISRTKFYYKIKGLTGKTPSEFFMQYKLNIAAKMLKEGKLNVSEIAARTGFNTLPHFSKAFKKQFGVSPSKYEG